MSEIKIGDIINFKYCRGFEDWVWRTIKVTDKHYYEGGAKGIIEGETLSPNLCGEQRSFFMEYMSQIVHQTPNLLFKDLQIDERFTVNSEHLCVFRKLPHLKMGQIRFNSLNLSTQLLSYVEDCEKVKQFDVHKQTNP